MVFVEPNFKVTWEIGEVVDSLYVTGTEELLALVKILSHQSEFKSLDAELL